MFKRKYLQHFQQYFMPYFFNSNVQAISKQRTTGCDRTQRWEKN